MIDASDHADLLIDRSKIRVSHGIGLKANRANIIILKVTRGVPPSRGLKTSVQSRTRNGKIVVVQNLGQVN
jgi:hypothetical protein